MYAVWFGISRCSRCLNITRDIGRCLKWLASVYKQCTIGNNRIRLCVCNLLSISRIISRISKTVFEYFKAFIIYNSNKYDLNVRQRLPLCALCVINTPRIPPPPIKSHTVRTRNKNYSLRENPSAGFRIPKYLSSRLLLTELTIAMTLVPVRSGKPKHDVSMFYS